MTIRETLIYSDYEIEEQYKSKIDQSKMITRTVGIICPHCKRKLKDRGHGVKNHCSCGLTLTQWGNGLECELKEV